MICHSVPVCPCPPRSPQPFIVDAHTRDRRCGVYECSPFYPCSFCREQHVMPEPRPAIVFSLHAIACCGCARLLEPIETVDGDCCWRCARPRSSGLD